MKQSFTLRHLKPYAARLAAYGFFVVCSVVFTMATALSVADFLKILFEPAELGAVAIPASGNLIAQWLQQLYSQLILLGQFKALILFSLLLFVLYALKNVTSYVAAVQVSIVKCKAVRNIRNELFAKAMRAPMSYYGSSRKGDMISRFGNDVVEYEEGILNSIQMLVASVVGLVLYLAMLFCINVRLTLFVLCALPVVALVISGITHRLRRKSLELQERNSFLTSLMEETIMGLKIIKAYTAIDFSNRRFREADHGYARLRTRVLRRMDLSSPVSDFLGNGIVIGILLLGSYMVMGGSGLTPELFVSYIMLFVLMIPPAKDLSTAISQMRKGRACVDRMQEFLDVEETVTEHPQAVPFGGLSHSVEISHVGFCYQPDVPVLSDVCLTVPKGSTLALVGSSGSGKSTLADLVLRFYDCTEGDILLDGTSIRRLRLADLRRHVAVVAQDTVLFNDTIRANIAFGHPDASMQDIERAARIAQAHDFILQQPEGYDTCIGDGGSLLSGGQRQRLSIARAVLGNPGLLVFDEATSALDTESERQVQQALDNLLQGRTAIIIAHRLSTIQNADQIAVLEQGRVVELGTHSELMQRQGRYFQLVQMQSFA